MDIRQLSDQELMDALGSVRQSDENTGLSALSDDDLIKALRQNSPLLTDAEPSLLDQGIQFVSDTAQAASDAATGEGTELEFPDMPELTEMPVGEDGIGLFESIWPNMKMGLTMQPEAKARIVAEHFKGDPRLGGVFKDAYGHPIVVWQGQGYYVNKPGISMQDGIDAVAQTAQLLPASKVASAGPTMMNRLKRGALAFGATDLAQQYGTIASGGKDSVDLGSTATLSTLGGVGEAVLPPVMKGTGQVLKNMISTGQQPVPKAATAAMARIPLTRGQRTGNIAQISREEAMRKGGYSDAAQGIMRNFDDMQQNAIRDEALALQGRLGTGTGLGGENVAALGARMQDSLIGARDAAKSGVRAAYDRAGAATGALSKEGIQGFGKRLRQTMSEWPVKGMPQVQQLMREVDTYANWGGLREVNLKGIEQWRKRVSKLAQSSDRQLAGAANAMKGTLDDYLDEALTNGLLNGDDAALSAFKEARTLHTEFMRRFGAGKTASGISDPAGRLMVKVLDEAQATPEQVVNFLTGYGRITSDAKSVGLVRRMKDIFGPSSEQMGLLKDAYLLKALTKEVRGARTVTAGAVDQGARDMLEGRGLTLARELFTPDELARVGTLAREVRKTITPADATNPSKTSYSLMRLLKSQNLLSQAGQGMTRGLGKAMKFVPLGDTVGGALESAGGAMAARAATSQAGGVASQAERIARIPLLEAGTVAGLLKAGHATQEQKARNPRPKTQQELMADALRGDVRPTQTDPKALADVLRNGPR